MPIAIRTVFALALGLAAGAEAGVIIETSHREGPEDEAPELRRVYVQDGVGRFEDGERVTLLRGETLTIIDDDEETYTVLDRESIRAVGERMGGAMAQMREQMASMTPEQRAMMERMMGGQLPGPAAPAKVEVIDARRTETVDGRSCRVWTVKRDEVPEQQHCVVPFDTLPGDEDLRALFQRMASLFGELRTALPQGDDGDGDEFEAYAKMNGYPVLTRELSEGEPNGAESRLVAWRAEPVPAAKFTVPAGYTKRELGGAPDAD
jgi:hypothetical protein